MISGLKCWHEWRHNSIFSSDHTLWRWWWCVHVLSVGSVFYVSLEYLIGVCVCQSLSEYRIQHRNVPLKKKKKKNTAMSDTHIPNYNSSTTQISSSEFREQTHLCRSQELTRDPPGHNASLKPTGPKVHCCLQRQRVSEIHEDTNHGLCWKENEANENTCLRGHVCEHSLHKGKATPMVKCKIHSNLWIDWERETEKKERRWTSLVNPPIIHYLPSGYGFKV